MHMADENARFRPSRRRGRLAALTALRPRAGGQPGRRRRHSRFLGGDRGDGDRHARKRGLPAEAAPGDALLRWLPDLPIPDWAGRFVALCADAGSDLWRAQPPSFLFMWLMWSLMAVAMMLPSAAPMIRTYCEIADTARAKGEAAAHPLVLVAGYLSVWLAAAAAFRRPSACWCNRRAGAPVIGYAGGRRAWRCRPLPVQRAQGSLPEEMPQPVRDPVLALEQPSVAHLPARRRAGRLVPGLLLGADARDVRRRHDERLLDGADRCCLPWWKNKRPAAFPLGLPARYCLYGRRRCY